MTSLSIPFDQQIIARWSGIVGSAKAVACENTFPSANNLDGIAKRRNNRRTLRIFMPQIQRGEF